MKKAISVLGALALTLGSLSLGITGCSSNETEVTSVPETAPTTTETEPSETTPPTTTETTRATNAWTDYSDKVDGEELLARGQEHFQEELDPDKRIDQDDAYQYAVYLDGPVITMENSPAIDYTEYYDMDHDKLLKESEPVYISVETVADTYPMSFYSPKTESPEIYFIVEKLGGKDAGYFDTTTKEVNEIIYYIAFRISIRNIETDELICWFTSEMGYSPKTMTLDQYGMCDYLFLDNGQKYLRSKGGNKITSLYCLYRLFQYY